MKIVAISKPLAGHQTGNTTRLAQQIADENCGIVAQIDLWEPRCLLVTHQAITPGHVGVPQMVLPLFLPRPVATALVKSRDALVIKVSGNRQEQINVGKICDRLVTAGFDVVTRKRHFGINPWHWIVPKTTRHTGG